MFGLWPIFIEFVKFSDERYKRLKNLTSQKNSIKKTDKKEHLETRFKQHLKGFKRTFLGLKRLKKFSLVFSSVFKGF